MTIDKIDFAPLEDSKNAVKLAAKQLFKAKRSQIIMILIFVLVMMALWYGFKNDVGVVASDFLNASFFCGVAVTVLVIYKAKKIKEIAWRQFAIANGWHIDPALAFESLIPPTISSSGHSRKPSEVITAEFENHVCRLLTYEFTVGHGKSSHTYYFTLAVINLGEPFPHIILDSKKNFGGIRKIPFGYQDVKLEGDFHTYFKLFMRPGEHIDVLSIIAPDVMQTLIDANQQQDIEIYGSNLYFVGINDHRNPAGMKFLLRSVDKLTDEFVHKAKTLNYKPTTY